MRRQTVIFLYFCALLAIIGWQTISTEEPFYTVTYTLSWQDETAVITNNLGYDITITEGTIHHATVELIPCAEETAWYETSVAYAGHGEAVRASRMVIDQSETMPPSDRSFIGQSTLTSTTKYCQIHYLLANTGQSATLNLKGIAIAPNTKDSVPFHIQTDMAWGGLLNLPTPIHTSTQVEIIRSQKTLFENIDFLYIDEAVETAVLRNLINHTTIHTTTQQ